MVMERIPMHVVIEVLTLFYQEGKSIRGIARALGISRPTVGKYLECAKGAGIDRWPMPGEEEDGRERLRTALYSGEEKSSPVGTPLPDWKEIDRELNSGRKNGVTRHLLWQEYRMEHPGGLGYSQFCALYNAYVKNGDLRIHLTHPPGEELYVDYSGPKVTLHPVGKDPYPVSIFVAVMGLSAYTFACATLTMKTPDWIRAHMETFRYLGGVPKVVIPDCTKTAVTAVSRYEPTMNRAYREMGRHMGCEIFPARPASPRDKGAAEAGVLNTQRALLAPLRGIKFPSIADLNRALRERCDLFNRTPFQKRPDSRVLVFEAFDRPALGPLPPEPFETEEWIVCRVHLDYHISHDRSLYSVPHPLVGKEVDVRLTARTVEIFYREERVASHFRLCDPRTRRSTVKEHMPPNHRHYLERTDEFFLGRAAAVGPEAERLFVFLFERCTYPPLAYRTCQGILSLLKTYPAERLDVACGLALRMRVRSYKAVKGILDTGTDRVPPTSAERPTVPLHDNIRGPAYYTPPTAIEAAQM